MAGFILIRFRTDVHVEFWDTHEQPAIFSFCLGMAETPFGTRRILVFGSVSCPIPARKPFTESNSFLVLQCPSSLQTIIKFHFGERKILDICNKSFPTYMCMKYVNNFFLSIIILILISQKLLALYLQRIPVSSNAC